MARQRKGLPVNGWLVLDKPRGMTSTMAVARVKRLFEAAKAGHAGTLDPLATGVLPIAFGEATKTVTLGAQVFIGQFVTNWNAVLAALSLAILPVLVLYLIFSRQLIRGITAGAVK